MKACCVPNCHNKSARRHSIPREKRIRDIWIQRINNPKFFGVDDVRYFQSYYVCEEHFEAICKDNNNKLKKFALPTLHLPEYVSEGMDENCFSFPPTTGYITPEKLRDALKKVPIEPTSLGDSPDMHIQPPKKTYRKQLFSAAARTSGETIPKEDSVKKLAASLAISIAQESSESTSSTSGLQTEHESSTNARTETKPMPVKRFTKMCRLCLSRKVNEQDEMPKYICKECYKQLVKTYLFRKKAALSDKILRRHLQRSYAEGSVTLPKNCPEKNLICSDTSDDKHTTNDRNTCTPQSSSKDNLAVIQDITSKSNNSSSGVTLGFAYSSVTSERPKTKANRICDNPTTESKVERKVDFAESVSTIETKVASVNSHKKIVLDLSNAPIRNDETENVKSAICCEKTELSPQNTKTRKVNTKPRVIVNLTKQLYQCNVCKKCFLHLKALKNHKLLHVTDKSTVFVDLT